MRRRQSNSTARVPTQIEDQRIARKKSATARLMSRATSIPRTPGNMLTRISRRHRPIEPPSPPDRAQQGIPLCGTSDRMPVARRFELPEACPSPRHDRVVDERF